MTNLFEFKLPRGIVPIIQTPFSKEGNIDFDSFMLLVEDAISAGADGLIFPGIASEVNYLLNSERRDILTILFRIVSGRIPIIVSTTNMDQEDSVDLVKWAEKHGAVAYLMAVPTVLYNNQDLIVSFFRQIGERVLLPMIIQDFEFNGPGMTMATIQSLKQSIPTFKGIKVETSPAGPKYSAIRNAFGENFYIAGGWAIPQFIEAMDRGIDAVVPECSMIRIYKRIQDLYNEGNREQALFLFRQILPVLSFTNQEVGNSIKFFKELLYRKNIIKSTHMRWPFSNWDGYSMRIAEELIELYLKLEMENGV